MGQTTTPTRARTTIPSRDTDGQESMSGVRLADLTGRPGRDAAVQLRRAELRPAMELVPSEERAGVVVGQIPAAGSLVARESLVRLLIASAAAEDAAPDPGEPQTPAEQARQSVEEQTARAGDETAATLLRATARRRRKPGLAERWCEEQPAEEWAYEQSERVPAGEHAWEPPRSERREMGVRPQLTRVQWLLVLGGLRVCWWEACGACLLATLAAWGIGGSRALAGLIVAGLLIGVGVIAARLAAHGEQRDPAGPDSMFVDLPERRWRQ